VAVTAAEGNALGHHVAQQHTNLAADTDTYIPVESHFQAFNCVSACLKLDSLPNSIRTLLTLNK